MKEKVWVHTSRDIRAIAGQLVKMWIELYNKEKATFGTPKLRKKQHRDTGSTKTEQQDMKRLSSSSANNTVDASAVSETKLVFANVGIPLSQSKEEVVVRKVTHLEAGSQLGRAEDAEVKERSLSEMEAAALAAAEAAQAAARAAAEVSYIPSCWFL